MNYCNNLKRDDRVWDVYKKRFATVANQPRETTVLVSVIYEGTTAPQLADVMNLRLLVDGKPEEIPPVDGEPTSFKPKAVIPRETAPATGYSLTSVSYPPKGLTPAEFEGMQQPPRARDLTQEIYAAIKRSNNENVFNVVGVLESVKLRILTGGIPR